MGPKRFNNALKLVRHVLALAMESGVIFSNPAEGLKPRRVMAKKLELPTLAQFSAFIAEIKASSTSGSAELAEGLVYTGCRVSEAARIEWRDLNFTAGEVFVKGDAVEATKNGEVRRVPMIPGARALFERMRERRPDGAGDSPVFAVKECQRPWTGRPKRRE
ncbi:MAG: tyrosine-type recombinase/integrase [Verrucomicrobiota bacterium]